MYPIMSYLKNAVTCHGVLSQIQSQDSHGAFLAGTDGCTKRHDGGTDLTHVQLLAVSMPEMGSLLPSILLHLLVKGARI